MEAALPTWRRGYWIAQADGVAAFAPLESLPDGSVCADAGDTADGSLRREPSVAPHPGSDPHKQPMISTRHDLVMVAR